jgi:hypothetical protein
MHESAGCIRRSMTDNAEKQGTLSIMNVVVHRELRAVAGSNDDQGEVSLCSWLFGEEN